MINCFIVFVISIDNTIISIIKSYKSIIISWNIRVEVSNIIKIGEIEINLDSYEVYKNNSLIDLSTREFELLAYLMKNAGIVLSKEKIFNSVWGENYGEIGTVAVHIKSLRNKLDPDEKYIKTIWGLGYKFIKVLDEH